MNPNNLDRVEKARIFDILLLLMFNVGHLPEPQICQQMAKYLMNYLGSCGVTMTIPVIKDSDSSNNTF